jgi:tetratricopeptide (TPR) repeat protein
MGRVFWPSAVEVDDDLVATLARRAIVSEHPESVFSGRREFAFKHALTHEVAYATLPRYERGSLHRHVAEWLAESIPDRQAETTELVAFHFEQALRWGDPDEELGRLALEALLEATDADVRRGAYASAARLLERALELAVTDHDHSRVLLVAARVDIFTSQYERALARLDDVLAFADTTMDAMMRADALGLRARAAWLDGRWQEALGSAESAVATLEGLPESQELARALARLSQIQMLRALPDASSTASRGITVARRTGEVTAEVNARINLWTVEANELGTVPSTEDISSIVELAFSAGAHDEATRSVVNYLWSATLLGESIVSVERFVTEMTAGHLDRGTYAEAFGQYLPLSLATLIYVPAGRWVEADAVASREVFFATSRLVWLWLATGQALRRGRLDVADRYLPELRELALASEEPQRIVPMASVAMPRAVIAGDTDDVRLLADTVLGLRRPTFSNALFLAIPRALAAIGDRTRLEALRESLTGPAPGTRIVESVAQGLLASLSRDQREAARALTSAEDELRAIGRHYDAACVAIELARSLEEAGDGDGARVVRARAAVLLEPLACVNPY